MVKNKRKFDRLESKRVELVEYLMSECDLIQGSYTEILVKCGRSVCHCEMKPCHLVARLGTRKDGKIRNQVVRVVDRDYVKQLIENYKKHKKALRDFTQIQEEQKSILKELIQDKDKRYQ